MSAEVFCGGAGVTCRYCGKRLLLEIYGDVDTAIDLHYWECDEQPYDGRVLPRKEPTWL